MSVTDNAMTIRYKVGLGNYVAFFGVWVKRTLFDKTNRRLFLVCAAIIGVMQAGAALQFVIPLFKDLPAPLFWVTMALAFAIASLFYGAIIVFILRPLVQFLWHLGSYLISPKVEQTVYLSATGVTKSSPNSETTTAWRGVTAFVETRKTLLLFTSRNAAMIIPKSAFASPEDAHRFTASARDQWEDAHSVF